jgi:hypothetical protein
VIKRKLSTTKLRPRHVSDGALECCLEIVLAALYERKAELNRNISYLQRLLCDGQPKNRGWAERKYR